MKELRIEINQKYNLYDKNTKYSLCGDLIILSGLNGSGKSQLLRIIADKDIPRRNSRGQFVRNSISRKVLQISGKVSKPISNALLLSFNDSVNVMQGFGMGNASSSDSHKNHAYNFYKNFILKNKTLDKGWLFYAGAGSYDEKVKNPAWRSIDEICSILNENKEKCDIFNLTEEEFKSLLPLDFIWKIEDEIIGRVADIFYQACLSRLLEKEKYADKGIKFNNDEWLKKAPWTILNDLFADLKFKYKFKKDYRLEVTRLIDQPQLLDDDEARNLIDLSDGERSILKLALISLDKDIGNEINLVLFDEYDAPLNPSLTDAFYKTITKFYIDKGIQVVIVTHSPATISMAPHFATFYEIFDQNNHSPKIILSDKFNYSELEIANKNFYEKISDQGNRIKQLENELERNKQNSLFVEDKYSQIYKIAYLKLKKINFNERDLDEVFQKNSNFAIHDNFAAGGLYHRLSDLNTSLNITHKSVCLFDYDNEGYSHMKKVINLKQSDGTRMYDCVNNDASLGICYKNKSCEKYAMLLPIPIRLSQFINQSAKFCYVEIESLLPEQYLKSNSKTWKESELVPIYSVKNNHKKDFWKDLISAPIHVFNDFKPLFDQLNNIFDKK